MNEGDFRLHLQKGLASQGAFAYKIPDLARCMVKPFDLVVGMERKFVAIEVKLRKFNKEEVVNNYNVLIPSLFRPHQIPTLESIEEKGQGYGFVAVLVVNEQQPRFKEAWLLRVSHMKERGYKISWGDLKQLGHPLIWVPKVGWTLPTAIAFFADK